jgi:hypothetical protein
MSSYFLACVPGRGPDQATTAAKGATGHGMTRPKISPPRCCGSTRTRQSVSAARCRTSRSQRPRSRHRNEKLTRLIALGAKNHEVAAGPTAISADHEAEPRRPAFFKSVGIQDFSPHIERQSSGTQTDHPMRVQKRFQWNMFLPQCTGSELKPTRIWTDRSWVKGRPARRKIIAARACRNCHYYKQAFGQNC